MNRLHQFVDQRCRRVHGCRTRFAVFVDAFHRWLPTAERQDWPRHKVAAGIDEMALPRGKLGGQIVIGDLQLETHRHVLDGGRLRREPI